MQRWKFGLDSVSDALAECGIDDSEIDQYLLVEQCGYRFGPETKMPDEQVCFGTC